MSERADIFIIGDRPEFGRVVSELIRQGEPEWGVRHATYEQSRGIWGRTLLKENDLFVLELFKRYETGLRAEGIGVARKLLEAGTSFVIVAPFDFRTAELLCFWAPESPRDFLDVCKDQIESSPYEQEVRLDLASTGLGRFLTVPTGHSDIKI